MTISTPTNADGTDGGGPVDGSADDEGPTGGTPPPRHHWFRIAALALGAVAILGVAFVVGSFVLRDQPEAKSVDEAVGAYRDASSVPAEPSFHQPAAGVYEAAGSGKESISTPPLSQQDGATMPITVQLQAKGCWLWRIDYNSAHWHEYRFCPKGKGLILAAQRNFQSWDLGVDSITNLATTTCDPPAAILVDGAEPGDTMRHSCTGVNTASAGESTAAGPSTMVGTVDLVIGDETVRTVHQRRRITMTGAQKGTIDEDWWLQEGTGLPIRVDRAYELKTDSIIGEITYTERGSWQLTSMTPRT